MSDTSNFGLWFNQHLAVSARIPRDQYDEIKEMLRAAYNAGESFGNHPSHMEQAMLNGSAAIRIDAEMQDEIAHQQKYRESAEEVAHSALSGVEYRDAQIADLRAKLAACEVKRRGDEA